MLHYHRRRLLGAAAAAVGPVLVGACSASAHKEESVIEEDAGPRPRVLITGFNDWRDLEGNLFRCRDNPSCRLLLGAPHDAVPTKAPRGPLVRALLGQVDADFFFTTLPVTWGTAVQRLDRSSFDMVIHLGLGVYDSTNKILLERGAYNLRCAAKDASGAVGPNQKIEEGGAECLLGNGGMQLRYEALARCPPALVTSANESETFMLVEAPARAANTYICNETHWSALMECEQPGRLKAAYFIHVPYAHEDDPTHEKLAAAVATLIERIVRVERNISR